LNGPASAQVRIENRINFLIIECKKVGMLIEANRNPVPTVSLIYSTVVRQPLCKYWQTLGRPECGLVTPSRETTSLARSTHRLGVRRSRLPSHLALSSSEGGDLSKIRKVKRGKEKKKQQQQHAVVCARCDEEVGLRFNSPLSQSMKSETYLQDETLQPHLGYPLALLL
jgi:hypothetical protein